VIQIQAQENNCCLLRYYLSSYLLQSKPLK